jgi:hypothetical protein
MEGIKMSEKKCLKEVIKMISLLEEEKSEMLSDEAQNSIISYGKDEEKPESTYNFADTRISIECVNAKIRHLRHLLHYANATVKVPEFEMSIGECIIFMAQLSNEKAVLERMARREPKTRRATFGGTVDWTEICYSREECRTALKNIIAEITALQMAVDKTNLAHEVVID